MIARYYGVINSWHRICLLFKGMSKNIDSTLNKSLDVKGDFSRLGKCKEWPPKKVKIKFKHTKYGVIVDNGETRTTILELTK